jgi:flagellar hook-length control protein FliK
LATEPDVANTLPGNPAAAATAPLQTVPTPSTAAQNNTNPSLAPTAPSDPGVSTGDQSGEFTFTERQQAELAARLSREQAGDAERQVESQQGASVDTGKSAALEFSRQEPNTLTLPLNAPRPGMLEAPTAQNLTLSLPADKANWAEPLADRIAMMIQKGGNTAELRLNPPHLGRLEVQFTVNGDQASIVVSTASAEIRDALQQSLPRLEALLQNSGLQLADSQITDQQPRHADDLAHEQQFDAGEDVVESNENRSRVASGLIDTYA